MFGLTSCFLLSRNKNIENAFLKGNVFLDLVKITLVVTAFSFYPKWDSWFQLKIVKTRFYSFQFLVRLGKYFHWKCFQKSNQTHFHHHFLFPVKMKTENNQIKHLLIYLYCSVPSVFHYFLWKKWIKSATCAAAKTGWRVAWFEFKVSTSHRALCYRGEKWAGDPIPTMYYCHLV